MTAVEAMGRISQIQSTLKQINEPAKAAQTKAVSAAPATAPAVAPTATDFATALTQAVQGTEAAAPAAAQAVTAALAANPASPVRTGAVSGNDVVEQAKKYIGVPYVWGGTAPGQGLDCSGLTQYAYAQAGVRIPRNSRAQYLALPKVARDELKPGDLVFWARDTGDPATIHHVAIWLGADRVLQAPESGDVVQIAPMDWAGYAGAVRPTG